MDQKKYIDKAFDVWKLKNNIQHKADPPDVRQIIDQIANLFAPGSYYYYIINFINFEFEYVHPTIKDVLKIDPEEFNLEYFLSIHHPDDLKVFHEKENVASEFLFNFLQPEEIPDYKVVYVNRVRRSDGRYIKLLHQARAIRVSLDGKAQHVLGVHTDITHLNIPLDNKVSFVGLNGKPSYYSVDPKNSSFEKESKFNQKFTEQELRIINFIANGLTSAEIAQELFIAESTVKSHRKNILEKSNSKNITHLVANCLREGII